MARQRRPPAHLAGAREARAIAANLARELARTRRKRRLTQRALGALVAASQTEISYLERGFGARTTLQTWIAIGIALNRPVAVGFSRNVADPLNDAGHLEAQELVTRIVRGAGWSARFEVPDDPRAPTGSTDLRLDRPDSLALVEIWNRFDDLGAAARSSDRKLARAPGAASLWLLVDTAANRDIVRRYPSLLRARFPGSSRAWVAALTTRAGPPEDAGLAWIDVRSGRLRPLRWPAE